MLTSRRAAGGTVLLAAAALMASSALAAPAQAAPADTVGGPALASAGVVVHLGAGAAPLPKVDAVSWLLADLTTGEVLAAKGAHVKVMPASTLKTLTALTLMPKLDPSRVVTATQAESGAEGSRVGLVAGSTYSVRDLWNALLLPSANDAAAALADANGGFGPTISQMQAAARDLGALDTTVKSPSGLDHPGQVTSAYDMALFARAALALPLFRTVTLTRHYTFPGRSVAAGAKRTSYEIYTENRLLRHNFKGTVGGKTGFTSLAHRTFWGAAERGGHTLVVTLFQIHEPTETAAKALLSWGFANRAHVTPVGTLVAPTADAAAGGSTQAVGAPTAAGGSSAAMTTAIAKGHRALFTVGLVIVALMAAVAGWLWWRRRHSEDDDAGGSPASGRVAATEAPAVRVAPAAAGDPVPGTRATSATPVSPVPPVSRSVVVGPAPAPQPSGTAGSGPQPVPEREPAVAGTESSADPAADLPQDDPAVPDVGPVPAAAPDAGGHVRVVRPATTPPQG